MLLVKTKIGPSKIAGIGLFAGQFIPKGTFVWRFQEGFDLRFDKDYLETLPELTKNFFLKYAYQNPKTLKHVLAVDNARFFNHSNTSNTQCVKDPDDEESMDVAICNIQEGEEITNDYRELDTDPFYGFEK
jgi:SET domain-containing protein